MLCLPVKGGVISPLRILSDAPKFRAECLQTLRDGEVEEESAAPPSTDTTISSPLVHDFILSVTGEVGPCSQALQDCEAAAENGNRDSGQGLPFWLK
ncbi:hypothetical protein INR49_028465 [Caranx melampygus]|nr:hypothetical protein INR49_028465 [Caranx melampygus]